MNSVNGNHLVDYHSRWGSSICVNLVHKPHNRADNTESFEYPDNIALMGYKCRLGAYNHQVFS